MYFAVLKKNLSFSLSHKLLKFFKPLISPKIASMNSSSSNRCSSTEILSGKVSITQSHKIFLSTSDSLQYNKACFNGLLQAMWHLSHSTLIFSKSLIRLPPMVYEPHKMRKTSVISPKIHQLFCTGGYGQGGVRKWSKNWARSAHKKPDETKCKMFAMVPAITNHRWQTFSAGGWVCQTTLNAQQKNELDQLKKP